MKKVFAVLVVVLTGLLHPDASQACSWLVEVRNMTTGEVKNYKPTDSPITIPFSEIAKGSKGSCQVFVADWRSGTANYEVQTVSASCSLGDGSKTITPYARASRLKGRGTSEQLWPAKFLFMNEIDVTISCD